MTARAAIAGSGALALLAALVLPHTLRAQETPLDTRPAEELMEVERDLSGAEAARDRAEARARAAARAVLRLQEELVAAGARAQTLEQAVDEAEAHLDGLIAARAVSEALLDSRRAQLVESLAALQRLDLEPPPALLVRPEDALSAARGAMLLGTLVPELRGMADDLANRIRALDGLAREITAERDRLARDRVALETERRRIDELLAAREEERLASGEDAARAQARYAALADRARSLRDLLGGLEEDVPTFAALRPGLAGETAPAPFSERRGTLQLPAVGRLLTPFGADDGAGSVSQGISIAAGRRGEVVSPTDAEIVFAGPFRTYGNVLIIAPGDNYLMVLAGLAEVYGAPGQRLLAGEPVGRLPERAAPGQSAPARGDAGGQPVLYIELRRNGTPVDPAPWMRFSPRPA